MDFSTSVTVGLQFLLFLNSLYFHSVTIFAASLPADHTPLENTAISCGSAGNSTASNGRIWVGDTGAQSSMLLQLNGKSTKSRVTRKDTLVDSIPYETARISHHEFTYTFTQMKAGQKFIRLHFYPAPYKGFKKSRPFFTVKAGPYTLLHNFSASLESGASGMKYVSKEFCVNLEENQDLSISFSPSPRTRGSDDIYAFVNGIEIVSMPAGLYFTRDGDLGPPVVGQKYRFYIDNSTALEMIQRLTVGGNSIPSVEDPRMYRAWDEDLSYLTKPGGVSIRRIIPISYLHTPSYAAPTKVYQTARSMAPLDNLKGSILTWQIPVDLGFRYLLRLHFCELEFGVTEDGDREFSIFINNQVVESNANVIKWGGKHGVAVYRDYVLPMDGDRMEGKRFLNITLQAKFVASDKTNNAILNGLEIFKLSNPDNNLAGLSPMQLLHGTKSWIPESQKKLSFGRKNAIATAVTIIIMLLNIAVYHLRRVSESNSAARNKRIPFSGILSRQFSLAEIQSTTNNFNSDCLIGSGGYGRVYKGSIDGGAVTVAIKRMKSESRGENEFWTEIKMLSKVRHEHLVPLIGYCNEGNEKLLVYEYMPRGTLADHLYKIGRSGVYNPPLSWEQRLKISVGAARGLYFLHKHRVIHRDVKSSNILVDENWVAKISDFGLSKMGPANDTFTHISTNIKGTFGYLDPEYFLTRRLTRKSDVYAFGVVLFEVLSSRPAIDIRLEEEQHGLASWARYCIRKGKINQVTDRKLLEQISPACLKVFVGIAGRCIHNHPHERPSMSDIVMSLELALSLQQNPASTEQEEEEIMNVARSYSDQSDGVVSFEDLPVNTSNGELENNEIKEVPGAGFRAKEGDRLRTSRKENNSTSGSVPKWWWGPLGFLPRSSSKAKASQSLPPNQNQKLPSPEGLRQFSGQEIRKATNNFHNSLAVGFGGSNYAYKGLMDGGQRIVAIKRSSATELSLWMAQSKTEMGLSRRHPHVVSLVGYCNEEPNIVLVYEYMVNGTLHDHLYDPDKNPLPWKRRLQICIGAARGLSHLQSTVKNTILHRSFGSANIFLDDNWVAKVSYFESSARKFINVVPTMLGGNFGYLDSDYIRDEQLTEKSYVFSFGLVLFEILCATKESTRWLDEDQVRIVQWIKSGLRSNFAGRIDPDLMHNLSPECLGMFIETASKCLLDKGTERPSMNEIVASLEVALLLQEAADGTRGH